MLSNKIIFEKPKVYLIAWTQGRKIGRKDKETGRIISYNKLGPDEIAGYAALGDRSKEPMYTLWKEDAKNISKESIRKKIDRIIESSFGLGHGSVGDPPKFIFSIENLTRAATLQLTGPEYLEHEQQSMRFVTAERGYYVPESLREPEIFESVRETMDYSFLTYKTMVENGIPTQDARFILPLCSKTNISTAANERELQHLHAMNGQGEVPSYVKYVVENMIGESKKVAPSLSRKMKANYEILAWRPSTQLYSSENETIERLIEELGSETSFVDESSIPMTEREIHKAVVNKEEPYLSNLKHFHYTFLIPLSVAGNHQLRRQRTLHLADQSIYQAVEREEIVTPPSIRISSFSGDYLDMNRRMFKLYNDLIETGVERSEAIGLIPHSTKIRSLIDVDGHNVIHFIGKRRCTTAQWEIRNEAERIAEILKKELDSPLSKYAVPQCGTYGYCPEKEPCALIEKFKIN